LVLSARACSRLLVAAALGAALGALAQTAAGEAASIRDGVFTAEQARRGQTAYTGPCDRCHGFKLDGAPDDPDMFSTPPIGGPKFLRNWNGRSLGALFEYTRTTMPFNNPGFLGDQEFADVLAYMLQQSGAPAGELELEPDLERLGRIVIEAGQ
jgi:mono/diheme cytochrome c family protein